LLENGGKEPTDPTPRGLVYQNHAENRARERRVIIREQKAALVAGTVQTEGQKDQDLPNRLLIAYYS